MLEQAAQPFTVNDLAVITITDRLAADQLIPNSLVRPFLVIMLHESRDNVVEVLLAKHHEVVQALLPQRLDESLDVGGHVRATRQKPLDSDALRFEDFIELRGELRVRVVDEIAWHLLLLGELHADVSCLLGHPRGILVRRGGGNPDAPTTNMDEN